MVKDMEVVANGEHAVAGGASLLGNVERLKLERDVEQLRAELVNLREGPAPWWKRGAIVTTMTALIAAVMPVTTAVQAHYQKERELVLQEGKQAHEIRTSYLDRLEKPGAKLRTLRFVTATTSDPGLQKWASDEAMVVQAELADVDRQLKALSPTWTDSTCPVDDVSVQRIASMRSLRCSAR